MKKFILFIPVFVFMLFAGCNSQTKETADAPCTYTTKTYPATLVLIKRKDRFTADLIFRVTDNNGSIYRDSVSWFIENKSWIQVPDILEKEITIGNNYKYLIEEIKTGNCNPKNEKLTLEKFDK